MHCAQEALGVTYEKLHMPADSWPWAFRQAFEVAWAQSRSASPLLCTEYQNIEISQFLVVNKKPT